MDGFYDFYCALNGSRFFKRKLNVFAFAAAILAWIDKLFGSHFVYVF